jgi:hypothetical protein
MHRLGLVFAALGWMSMEKVVSQLLLGQAYALGRSSELTPTPNYMGEDGH